MESVIIQLVDIVGCNHNVIDADTDGHWHYGSSRIVYSRHSQSHPIICWTKCTEIQNLNNCRLSCYFWLDQPTLQVVGGGFDILNTRTPYTVRIHVTSYILTCFCVPTEVIFKQSIAQVIHGWEFEQHTRVGSSIWVGVWIRRTYLNLKWKHILHSDIVDSRVNCISAQFSRQDPMIKWVSFDDSIWGV